MPKRSLGGGNALNQVADRKRTLRSSNHASSPFVELGDTGEVQWSLPPGEEETRLEYGDVEATAAEDLMEGTGKGSSKRGARVDDDDELEGDYFVRGVGSRDGTTSPDEGSSSSGGRSSSSSSADGDAGQRDMVGMREHPPTPPRAHAWTRGACGRGRIVAGGEFWGWSPPTQEGEVAVFVSIATLCLGLNTSPGGRVGWGGVGCLLSADNNTSAPCRDWVWQVLCVVRTPSHALPTSHSRNGWRAGKGYGRLVCVCVSVCVCARACVLMDIGRVRSYAYGNLPKIVSPVYKIWVTISI